MAQNDPQTPPQVIDLTRTDDFFVSFQLNEVSPEFIKFLFNNIFPQYGLKVQDVHVNSVQEQQEFEALFDDFICTEQLDTDQLTETETETEFCSE